MKESRVAKSLLNAKVNVIFYFANLALAFFSRRIFIESLGDDFIGLTSTIYNLLGFLNLAELGIGTAIGYVLYKPLYDEDHSKISEILSVLGYLYKLVGLVLICGGAILAVFLPVIFPPDDTTLSYPILYFTFISFLTSSLIGYFCNYRSTLLAADQRNYVVTAYFQTTTIVKTIIQITLAYKTHNYFVWVSIELLFSIIYSIILNWKISKTYPWLKSEKKKGKRYVKNYPEIIKYVKQLFIHKIASFAQFQTTPFITYLYTSLQTVTLYTNYLLIANQLVNFSNKFLGSTEAAVGNLVAERNFGKVLSIYQELLVLRYFIAGVEVFAIYHLIDSFVVLWLGPEYVMSKVVLLLILTNMFIMQTRGTNDQFLFACGLFRDVWAAITETALSLGLSLLLGYFFGLPGVLGGSLTGMACIVLIWKPYFLFSSGFNKSVLFYWRKIFEIALILVVSMLLSSYIISFASSIVINSFFIWVAYAALCTSVYAVISGVLFYTFTQGARDFVLRFIPKLRKK